MFVTIFSSSVGGFTPSGAYFIVTVAKTCLVAGTISWGVHACCSPKPSFHGRGQHLTITETNLTPCQVLLRSLTLKHRSPVVSQQKYYPYYYTCYSYCPNSSRNLILCQDPGQEAELAHINLKEKDSLLVLYSAHLKVHLYFSCILLNCCCTIRRKLHLGWVWVSL